MAGGPEEEQLRSGQVGWRPVPDPTVLTTEALQREIGALHDLLIGRIDRLRELIADRDILYGNRLDQARVLESSERTALSSRLEASGETLLTRIKGAIEVQDQKFSGVDQQFDLVERQRVEQKNDTKAAVDAALTAQKEAVKEQTTASERAIAKSESGTSKQLEQLADNFKTALNGMTTSIDDLKGRVTRIESTRLGALESRSENRDSQNDSRATQGMNTGMLVAGFTGVGLLVTLASFLVYIATHH